MENHTVVMTPQYPNDGHHCMPITLPPQSYFVALCTGTRSYPQISEHVFQYKLHEWLDSVVTNKVSHTKDWTHPALDEAKLGAKPPSQEWDWGAARKPPPQLPVPAPSVHVHPTRSTLPPSHL